MNKRTIDITMLTFFLLAVALQINYATKEDYSRFDGQELVPSHVLSNHPSNKSFGVNNLFNGDRRGTFWETNEPFPHWIQISFDGKPVILTDYAFWVGVHGGDSRDRMPRAWEVLGSNEGKEWISLGFEIDQGSWKSNERRFFEIKEPRSFKFYRWVISEGWHPKLLRMHRLNVFSMKK